jgi:hypothetical protein
LVYSTPSLKIIFSFQTSQQGQTLGWNQAESVGEIEDPLMGATTCLIFKIMLDFRCNVD